MKKFYWIGLTTYLNLISFSLHSEQAVPGEKLKGKFTFDWLHIEKATCQKIDEKLLEKISQQFLCKNSSVAASSGVKISAVCSSKTKQAGAAEFLVFETKKDCSTERETQLANGD